MVEALSSPSLTQVRREARLCHNLHFLVYISEIRSRFREKLILTPMGIKGFLRGHLFSPFCQDFKVKNVKERFFVDSLCVCGYGISLFGERVSKL